MFLRLVEQSDAMSRFERGGGGQGLDQLLLGFYVFNAKKQAGVSQGTAGSRSVKRSWKKGGR